MVNTEITLIIFFAAKHGEALYSQLKKRSGADCGSDRELLIVKLRLKLKKAGKTTYSYTVEVRNRFKGLNLKDRVPDNYGWRYMILYRRQESRPSPRKRNAKKQNGCLRRPYK